MAGQNKQQGHFLHHGALHPGGAGPRSALVAAQAFPSVLEYQAALKAINKAKDETTVAEVRAAFDRAAHIDNITSIKGKDLEIAKERRPDRGLLRLRQGIPHVRAGLAAAQVRGQSRPGR
jgi:hypothetical protein